MNNWEGVYRLAFDKPENEPFADTELAIIQEWLTDQWRENMQADLDDPNILQQLAIYNKCLQQSDQIWMEILISGKTRGSR